ncbi:helix-turn-helix transcriptional regulator [Chondrinema litorale]|uniref:helix-turn-helix transcriptional regulator n=1 Tax=Chondrinema litorale TaxID=2994555 RepID=UPI00254332E1|nr:AraC family transcriptional regulator [Chondrinema litorale]UZR96545.1 AraC family transcriptional regulator [Chondrinema litorale]
MTKNGFMKLRIAIEGLDQTVYENNYQEYLSEKHGISEQTFTENYYFGKIQMHHIQFEGVYIHYGDMMLKEKTNLKVNSDFQIIEMHFAFSGSNTSYFDDQNMKFSFNKNQHNIVYLPHFNGTFSFDHASEYKMFEVGLSLSLFERLANYDSALMESMFLAIEQQKSSFMRKNNLPITPQMHFIIEEVINCNRTGFTKRLFIEAKIIELFMLQLEQFEMYEKPQNSSLKNDDIDKIYEAKTILENNLETPLSLMELSRTVGINDFKLKKGFKEVFGNTVFGYLNDLKMNRAQLLLLNNDLSVSEIARLTGYKNPTHFTAAFKKKFGVLPGSLKK